MGLEPAEFKEVKLLDLVVTGTLPLDFQAIESDSASGGGRSNILGAWAGMLGPIVGEWTKFPGLWLRIS